jgi:hypothetical protein
MQFNTAPSSTLFVKVNFKRTPYKNEVTALRVVAHNFEGFMANNALFLVDLDPENATLQLVNAVVEELRVKANALSVSVKIPDAAYSKLAKRG